ncbi:MAG: DUF655 domain-containing protein [Halobacteria archaeon]
MDARPPASGDARRPPPRGLPGRGPRGPRSDDDRPRREREEWAWVLDFLPYGHPDDNRPSYQKRPTSLGIGEKNLALLEMVPREGKTLQIQQRVYVGDDEAQRTLVDHVKRRILFDELTQAAKSELAAVLEKMVAAQEPRFVDIFNSSYPLTTRLHMLCLLPGVGQKMMQAVLEERAKKPFSGFAELSERVKGLHNPAKIVAKRIEEELTDPNVKYRLYTRP